MSPSDTRSTSKTSTMPEDLRRCQAAGVHDTEKGAPTSDEDQGSEKQSIGPHITGLQKAKALTAAILMNFITLGMTQSFGVFQAHYSRDAAVDGKIEPHEKTLQTTIASIGSLSNGGIVLFFGFALVPLLPHMHRIHVKFVCLLGASLMGLGLSTAIACKTVKGLVATQGFVFGLGSGLLNYPLQTILPEYFVDQSGFAQGLSSAAAGFGGIFFSLVGKLLLERVGTDYTLGILAITISVLGTVAAALAQPPLKLEKRSQIALNVKTLKDPLFTLLLLINFTVPLVIRVPPAFSPDFSQSLGYSSRRAAHYQALISAVGIPARIALGKVADRVGHQNTVLFSTFLGAVSTLAVWVPAAASGSKVAWVIYLVLYGVTNGIFVALIPSVLKKIHGDELYYAYSGAYITARGIGFVVGGPASGKLVKKREDAEVVPKDLLPVIVYTGTILTVSAIFMVLVRMVHAGRGKKWEWAQ